MTTPPPTIQDEKASSFLHIRAYPRDKSSWVRTAQRRGLKLAEHVTRTMNAESAKDEAENQERPL